LIVPQGIGEVFADPPIPRSSCKEHENSGAICLAVLCIILSLGLWPFHAPRNEVTWLKDSNGLSFGRSGTVISSDILNLTDSQDETCCSLEILAQPHPYQNSATLLAFYRPENPYQLRLNQSLVDFKLQAVIPNEPDHAAQANLLVPEVFRHATPAFITVTSGRDGTAVYVAGSLAGTVPFRIPKKAFTGRILLGDSPLRPDGWNGQIRGLAIYDSELTARQVFRHYDTWTKNGYPEVGEGERPIAQYLFDEHSGRVVHSKLKPGVDLHVPEKYLVVDKLFMEPFWQEFNMSREYWMAVLKNIVGFVPLGFCFYPYLSARQDKWAILLTIVVGAIVSLTIEILQGFLPTRDSGMTDVITNTLGTGIGVLLYRQVHTVLAERFPQLPFAVLRR
jgi:VanZ family protein